MRKRNMVALLKRRIKAYKRLIKGCEDNNCWAFYLTKQYECEEILEEINKEGNYSGVHLQ